MDMPNTTSPSPISSPTSIPSPSTGPSPSPSPSPSPIPSSAKDGEVAPVEIEDSEDEDAEDGTVGSKRKLTSAVWKEFKRVRVMGKVKAKCNWCHKNLGETRNETRHLHDHLKVCPYRRSKLNSTNKESKPLAQSSLRFCSTGTGKVSVENYTFDQEIARKELAAMIVLHEYPLCIVDHIGFRRFVVAVQPLFKMVTRNTIRKDIMDQFVEERKKTITYMAGMNSRVAITTDLLTSDNQKMGYMAITAHFVDSLWKLRSIIMRFIYVPAPHMAEVICEELCDALVKWNLDEKLSTITLDNCSTNDKIIPMLRTKLSTNKLMLKGKILHMRCCAHILNLIVKDRLVILKDVIETIRDTFAADVVERLKMFYAITELFSGTSYVTANIYFVEICEIKMKINNWSICGTTSLLVKCQLR